MPKKTKVLSDRYKSTTKIYPKVIMESLTPEVRVYIEGAGDNKYVTKQEESEPYVSSIEQSGDDIVLTVEDTELGGSCVLRLENGGFNVTLGDATNNYTLELTNTGDFTVQSTEGETIHSLTFDSEGNLKVDGNAVGGKQLYQHTLWVHSNDYSTNFTVSIINDSDITINTFDKLKNVLTTSLDLASGTINGSYICGIYASNNDIVGWTFAGSNTTSLSVLNLTYTDKKRVI